MEQRDKGRFAQALVAMGEMFDKDVSQALAVMYFDDLAPYSIDQVLGAMTAHRKDAARGRWFPKVADLVAKLQPTQGEAALLAWTEVPLQLRNSRAACSSNPITERVIQDLGGWPALGLKTTSELVWVEKEFARRYQTYAEHGTEVQALPGPRNGLRLIGGPANAS
jgi:hypothetical protein